MRFLRIARAALALAFGPVLLAGAPGTAAAAGTELLNVSYDPTRELYVDYNKAFAAYWQAKTGQSVKINQSHGGSGKQARAVMDGLDADVVTLGLSYDIDAIAASGALGADWAGKFPSGASPYTSTVVFLVRKGNPKGFKDWDDLVKPGVSVITSNPKSSAAGRWAYAAAYGYALRQGGGDQAKAADFIGKLYRNVPVLDSGARGSTTTFVRRGMGDVLLAWENEAWLAIQELGPDQFEIVTPPLSILAEPPVAVVDRVVDRKGTRAVATAYLDYLYSPEGQEIVARHHYRPRDSAVAAKYAAQFPKIETFTIDSLGGWPAFQRAQINDGGVFDQALGAAKQ